MKELPDLKVYFDGSCPLCRFEIAHYQKQEGSEDIEFVDVSETNFTEKDLPRSRALARFHTRQDGRLLSGAEAFVSIWAHLPKWQRLARLANRPQALRILEWSYCFFLPIRPHLSQFLKFFAKQTAKDKAE